jgi:hypothetical protein
MEVVSKISDTSFKVSTTTDQIVSLKTVKEQRGMVIQQLERLDQQVAQERKNLVNQISTLDRIIADAEKAGVKDEAVKEVDAKDVPQG